MFTQLTLILTRRCPFNCEYCGIVDNTTNETTEVALETYKKFFDVILAKGQTPFVTLIGGEPLLYKNFEDLIDYFNYNNIPYTVNTTGYGIAQEKKEKIFKKCKGVSTSLDFETGSPKSEKCKTFLNELVTTDKYGNPDEKVYGIVAELMLTHTNIDLALSEAEKLIKETNHLLIDPIFIEGKWNKHYDFASELDDNLLLDTQDWQKVIDFCIRNKDRVMFASENARFASMMKIPGRRAIDYCNPVMATTIDYDGSFRLCYRIKGKYKKLNIQDFINNYEDSYKKYVKLSFKNKKKKCDGCYWQCPWFNMVMGPDGQSYP